MAAGNVADGADHDCVREAVRDGDAKNADGGLSGARADIDRRKSLRQLKKISANVPINSARSF